MIMSKKILLASVVIAAGLANVGYVRGMEKEDQDKKEMQQKIQALKSNVKKFTEMSPQSLQDVAKFKFTDLLKSTKSIGDEISSSQTLKEKDKKHLAEDVAREIKIFFNNVCGTLYYGKLVLPASLQVGFLEQAARPFYPQTLREEVRSELGKLKSELEKELKQYASPYIQAVEKNLAEPTIKFGEGTLNIINAQKKEDMGQKEIASSPVPHSLNIGSNNISNNNMQNNRDSAKEKNTRLENKFMNLGCNLTTVEEAPGFICNPNIDPQSYEGRKKLHILGYYLEDEFTEIGYEKIAKEIAESKELEKKEQEQLKIELLPPVNNPIVEEKKIEKMPLDGDIIKLQTGLNHEFETRQNNGGNETVMAYGNTVAKNYYKDLNNHINKIWNLLGLETKLPPLENIDKIISLYGQVMKDLNHQAPEKSAIESSLERALWRHINMKERYLTGNDTQYDYLLMVSYQVLRFHEAFQKTDKDSVGILLSTYFESLVDQKGKCQPGMIGRMLTVHKFILDRLIEKYNA